MNEQRSTLTLRRAILQGLGAVTTLTLSSALLAADLTGIEYDRLGDGHVQVKMTFSEPLAGEPESFKIDNPPRIAIDLPDVKNQSGTRSANIGLGAVQTLALAETGDRTRAVFSLNRATSYDISRDGNTVLVTFRDSAPATATPSAPGEPRVVAAAIDAQDPVDFRRGPDGEGRLILAVGSTDVPMNMRREGLDIVVDLPDTPLEPGRFDVRDFGSPVERVDIRRRGDGSQITMRTRDAGEHMAWQTGNRLTIEVQPMPRPEVSDAFKPKEYTGERLTLKFQDIEVRPLLQLLADFTGNNIVVSDSVGGSMSLRLENVPWDQALDLILTTRGLSARKNGNVIFVAPTEELASRDAAELEARRQSEELAPLVTDIIQINYATAADIKELVNPDTGADSDKLGFLSERGSLTVDGRTNTLIVNDIPENIQRIRDLIDRVDTPIKQVLIETRIVIATDNFSRELGARWGVTAAMGSGNNIITTTGSGRGTNEMIGSAVNNIGNTGQPFPIGIPTGSGGTADGPTPGNRWNVNLPVADPTSQIGLSILGSNVLLDLELSALQAEGSGEIISNPKVITHNGHEAKIHRGQEVPFVSYDQGEPRVEYRSANLETVVTPQITPNNNVILDIHVTKNEPDFTRLVAGNPLINTREVNTKVQVRNGETVVLGGIYEYESLRQTDKVPFLGDLPAIGNLFKRNANRDNRFELLIFVTPKIIEGDHIELAASN